MIVKWHGIESKLRTLNGGGRQGALWGILEYLSQSNNNTDFLDDNRKFKFIDDLSIIQISNTNLKTQEYLNKIGDWTSTNQMALEKKVGKSWF